MVAAENLDAGYDRRIGSFLSFDLDLNVFFIAYFLNLNESCFSGGSALAGVKIPGGVLPWETDVDFLMATQVSHNDLLKIFIFRTGKK